VTGRRHKRRPTAKQASTVDEDTHDGHKEEEEEEVAFLPHPSRGGNGKFKRFQPYNYTRRGAVHNEDDDDDDETTDDQQHDDDDDDAIGVDAYYSNALCMITQQDRANLLFTARRLAVSASRQQGITNTNNGPFHRETSPALIDTRPVHYHPTNSQLGMYPDMEQTPAVAVAAAVSKGTKYAALADKGSNPTADDGAIIIARNPSLENGGDSDHLLAETPYSPGIPILKSTSLAVHHHDHDHEKDGGDDGIDIAAMLQQPVLSENLKGRTLLHQISMSPAPSPLHIPLDHNPTVSVAAAGRILPSLLPPPHIATTADILPRPASTTTTTTSITIPVPDTSPQIPSLPSPHLPNPDTTCFSAVERMCIQYATILQECHISEHPPLPPAITNQATSTTPSTTHLSSPSPSPLPPTKQKWLSVKEATQMVVGLGSIDIPLPLLERTHVSAVVAKLMSHTNLELASEAFIVADKWRKQSIAALQAAQNVPS
jgi:hypothetical protein